MISFQFPASGFHLHHPNSRSTVLRALLVVMAATVSLHAQVSFDRILGANAEPQNWLTHSGGVLGQRYSQLTEVTPNNVRNLELRWVFQALSLEKFEATPLVVDGVLYTVQAPNDVVALDAATGRVFWVYPYVPSTLARPCCGRINRGLAILGNTLFMGTIDGHVIAVDAKTGGLVWNVAVGGARPDAGYGFTLAPLVVKDKVIVGIAGAEFEGFWLRSTPARARKSGASTPFPALANAGMKPGRETAG